MKRNKPSVFRQDTYDACNGWAIEATERFLSNRGWKIVDKGEDYMADIDATRKGESAHFEVETKNIHFTCAEDFGFPSVSFLGRKKRLQDKLGGFYYIILSWKSDYAVMCHSDDIYKDEYIENIHINTRDRLGMDKFYRVPKNKCTFFKIRDKHSFWDS